MTRATVFNWFRLPVYSEKGQSYGQTKRDFYESRVYLQNRGRLSSTFNLNLNGLSTDRTISFYGIDFGYSVKATIKKLGKPNYRTTEKRLFQDHQIVFYRLKISTVNCIIQLHFHNDSFFLGVMEMRTGDKTLKDRLFDLIKQKYKIDDSIIDNHILDELGNSIRVREDVIPYVVYTTGDQKLKQELLDTAKRPLEEMSRAKFDNQALLLDMI